MSKTKEFDLEATIAEMVTVADSQAAKSKDLSVTSKRSYTKKSDTPSVAEQKFQREIGQADIDELKDDLNILLESLAEVLEVSPPPDKKVGVLAKRTIRVAEKYGQANVFKWFPELALIFSMLIILLPMVGTYWNKKETAEAKDEIAEGPAVETRKEF